MLLKTTDGYKLDNSFTENLEIDGHVTKMAISKDYQNKRIYIFDNVKHLQFKGSDKQHRLLDISYDEAMRLEIKNYYDHDAEIYDFQYDDFESHEHERDPVIYLSDVKGKILRLEADSLRPSSVRDDEDL